MGCRPLTYKGSQKYLSWVGTASWSRSSRASRTLRASEHTSLETQQNQPIAATRSRIDSDFPDTVKRACFGAVGVSMLLFVAAASGLAYLRHDLNVPTVNLPTLAETSAGVKIFDRHDKYICTVYADRDKLPVPLSKMSPNIRKAVMAAEDHTFAHHHGLDFSAIARACFKNWKAKKTVEGASTLTQQLARNLFLDKDDRSMQRKMREAFIAWDLEDRYSKPKIMEAYLNEIYFGNGVHGVERAASQYFNKHASQLTVTESAFLAGLIKSPSILGAPCNRALAMKRRDEVIENMAKFGYITQASANTAEHTKLAFKSGRHRLAYPHYIAPLLTELSTQISTSEWNHGYKVYSNLDIAAQQAAEKTLADGIKHAPKGINQGALVTVSLKDGAVLAVVGGVGGYEKTQWNRALHPHTAGSSFKPFVYLTGLINGAIKPNTIVEDAPMVVQTPGAPPWSPKNFDNKYKGWLTIRQALAFSRNICAARVGLAAGLDNVVRVAHAAGIGSQLDAYPSLSLGSCAVTPFEMANAYATLARRGQYIHPTMIRHIEDQSGKIVHSFAATAAQTLPAEQCAEIIDAMQDVVRHGTGTQARLNGLAVAGKTGTADKGKDIWFVGATPDAVTAVWGGNDQNKSVPGTHVTGGVVMAHIWNQYMTKFVSINKPQTIAFAPPQQPLAGGSAHDVYAMQMLATTDFEGVENSRRAQSSELKLPASVVTASAETPTPAAGNPQSLSVSASTPAVQTASRAGNFEHETTTFSDTVIPTINASPAPEPQRAGNVHIEQWQGNRRISSTHVVAY